MQSGVASRPENLRALAAHWRALAGARNLPAIQFEWIDAAAQHLVRDGQLHVLFVHAGGRLLAAAPLAARTMGGVRCLTSIDGGVLGEPLDFLATDAASLSELCRQVVKTGLPLHLDRVPAGSPTIAAFTELAQHHRLEMQTPAAAATPVVVIDRSWKDPEAHLPPVWQADYVSARHTAEQRGYNLFQVSSPPTPSLSSLLQELYELEFRGWRKDVGDALMQRRDLRDFLNRYAASMCQRGELRLGFYRIGPRTAAAVVAVQQEKMLSVLRTAYDGAFGECSPETLLMAELFRYAIGEKLNVVQFHDLGAPWTDPWPRQYRDCVALHVHPHTLRGMLGKALGRIVPSRKGSSPEPEA